MIRLKKLQKAKEEQRKNGNQTDNVAGTDISVAFLRAKRDLSEYEEIPGIEIFYEPNDPLKISLTIKPDKGYYNGGIFHFTCVISEDYPNAAPDFKCLEKIYHPNIDLEGHVCLNILRNDWKPTLTLQLIFAGILHLFLHPNPNDPLNTDAANNLAKFPEVFAHNVRTAMNGGYVGNERFSRITGFF